MTMLVNRWVYKGLWTVGNQNPSFPAVPGGPGGGGGSGSPLSRFFGFLTPGGSYRGFSIRVPRTRTRSMVSPPPLAPRRDFDVGSGYFLGRWAVEGGVGVERDGDVGREGGGCGSETAGLGGWSPTPQKKQQYLNPAGTPGNSFSPMTLACLGRPQDSPPPPPF